MIPFRHSVAVIMACLSTFYVKPLLSDEPVQAKKLPLRQQVVAENDYSQSQPLLNGLNRGIRTFEVDVFLVGDVIRVGSSIHDLRSKGTLEELYLAPLAKLYDSKHSIFQESSDPILLFLELKSDPNQTYRGLRPILFRYSSLLTTVRNNERTSGPISIILSGNVPRDMVTVDNPRFVAIDGRMSDMDSDAPVHLIPTISLRWPNYFRWQGRSTFTPLEKSRLNNFIERTHRKNRKLRFYATPDIDNIWFVLRDAQVDYIGGESYDALSQFFTPAQSPFESSDTP